MTRCLGGFGGCLLGCLASVALIVASAPAEAAHIPAADDVVMQDVPARSDARVRAYQDLKQRLRADPGNAGIADRLADAYIDFGRETGDVRYLGYAEATLKPWLQTNPVPIPIAVSHATILQSRHLFAEARSELEAILKRAPDNVQAWLTLATVAQVQGDLLVTNRACVQSANAGGPFFGIACSAQLRLVTGHADQSYVLLSQIAMGAAHEPITVKAWVEGLMADSANYQGKYDLADQHFRKALALTPGDNFLLASYADFLLDRNRAQDAFDLVKDYTQSDTSYLRMAFAEAALNAPDLKQTVWTMAARFAAMDMAGGRQLYQREQARFVLHLQHEPAQALALAEENWTVQRAPEDVRIFLEAALAANKPEAARAVIEFIDRTGLRTEQIDPLAAKVRAAL